MARPTAPVPAYCTHAASAARAFRKATISLLPPPRPGAAPPNRRRLRAAAALHRHCRTTTSIGPMRAAKRSSAAPKMAARRRISPDRLPGNAKMIGGSASRRRASWGLGRKSAMRSTSGFRHSCTAGRRAGDVCGSMARLPAHGRHICALRAPSGSPGPYRWRDIRGSDLRREPPDAARDPYG